MTLQVATANVLNLALPGYAFYPGQEPSYEQEHERKLQWLGGMLARLNADVVGFQEVWHQTALKAAVANVRAGLEHIRSAAPQLDKAQRWPTMLRYIVGQTLASQVPRGAPPAIVPTG